MLSTSSHWTPVNCCVRNGGNGRWFVYASSGGVHLTRQSRNRFASSGLGDQSWKLRITPARQRVRSRKQLWLSMIVGSGAPAETSSRTQRIMESLPKGDEAGGAGGTSSYEALKRLDKTWEKVRSMESVTGPAPEVVQRLDGEMPGDSALTTLVKASFDVVVCGGTLGVFVATALAQRGFKVAVVEKGQLKGRTQEWNISRKELYELVKIGVLTAEEAESVIAAEFNPNRVGFGAGSEIWVKDILNLGVSPAKLIEIMKERFLQAGGSVFEGKGLSKVDVFDDTAVVYLDNGEVLKSRLVLDCMGNASPIVRQVRWGQRPDGVCLVVGSCARGFENNSTSDVIFTNLPVIEVGKSKLQLFWEAFPAATGPKDRTTYLFTYLDAKPERPSLEELLEAYWDLLPGYQGVKLDDLKILRVLYGFFSTYRNSPLGSACDRILQIGDASGIQSPLSFGGFGSITRHLERLTNGLVDALEGDMLEKESLSLLNPYMPNLSGAWLLQRSMSVPVGANPPPDFINELLSINFTSMKKLGDPVMRPFLQDVVQFGPLAKTMGSMMLSKPGILPQIFKQVGIVPLFDWLVHFIGLGYFTFLSKVVRPLLQSWVNRLGKKQQFYWRRRFEAWKFGAGLDYTLE
ncbi:hypothetical protein R1sor_016204 [Riccia sorocarpa]|uniref:Lycopene beta-cyclase n=1 Tax=Riccia sorocarpa TaxID=122646 RepID=A0ABD3HEB3_9MARC